MSETTIKISSAPIALITKKRAYRRAETTERIMAANRMVIASSAEPLVSGEV